MLVLFLEPKLYYWPILACPKNLFLLTCILFNVLWHENFFTKDNAIKDPLCNLRLLNYQWSLQIGCTDVHNIYLSQVLENNILWIIAKIKTIFKFGPKSYLPILQIIIILCCWFPSRLFSNSPRESYLIYRHLQNSGKLRNAAAVFSPKVDC